MAKHRSHSIEFKRQVAQELDLDLDGLHAGNPKLVHTHIDAQAFFADYAKALKAAVTTYPKTADYDLEEDLTKLGIGEAMVTILSERGAPTPVVWTRMQPPASLMAVTPGRPDETRP